MRIKAPKWNFKWVQMARCKKKKNIFKIKIMHGFLEALHFSITVVINGICWVC